MWRADGGGQAQLYRVDWWIGQAVGELGLRWISLAVVMALALVAGKE